jgi:hypothetical protein
MTTLASRAADLTERETEALRVMRDDMIRAMAEHKESRVVGTGALVEVWQHATSAIAKIVGDDPPTE